MERWLTWNPVYPGDALTNIFALDVPTGRWFDNFLVTPGRDGAEKGSVPYGGGFVYDLKNDGTVFSPLSPLLFPYSIFEFGFGLEMC